MDVKVSDLRDALKLLQPVIPRKPTLPVIANVLLQDGKVIGTDLETLVMLDVKGIDGECLLPHKKAMELLKYIPGYGTLTIERENGTVKLSWAGGSAQYDVSSKDEYPDVRNIEPESQGEITDGDTVVASLKEMLTYRTTDQARPVLSGVTVTFGETMVVSAADGFRMAYHSLPLSYPAESQVVIPPGSVSLLCSLWEKLPPPPPAADNFISQIMSKRHMDISLSKTRLVARFGKITLMSNLIEGTPPNYAELIPKDPPIKVSTWAAELDRAVNRVRGLAKDAGGGVRLVWFDDKLYVSAKSKEMNDAISAELDAKTSGTVGKIAVNSRYLHEYLAKKEGIVTLAMSTPEAPLLLHYTNAPVVVIMPMFVEWDDKKAKAEAEAAETEGDEDPEETGETGEELPEEPEDELAELPADEAAPTETEPEPEEKPKKRSRRKK